MYHQQWTGQFDVNGQASQMSSPMDPQSPVAEGFVRANSIHEGRKTSGPPEPYMGAFGVSNRPEPQHMSNPYYISMGPPVEHQDHIMLRDNHHIQMGMHHREMAPAPLLGDPHPPQYRRRSPEEEGMHGLTADVPRSMTESPRPGRVKKQQMKWLGASRNSVANDPIDEHKNCFGEEVPPTLKSTCPDEECCIFESRWKHRNQKGQDMWESIQSDYNNRFQKCPGKEMLQMMLKRGRSKYIDWLERDEDLLREAYKIVEKSRYQMMLETFYKLGGSRNMQLNASDIEVKVVNDLKLEEGIYMGSYGDLNNRRRRRSVQPRKRMGYGNGDNDLLSNNELVSIGPHNTCKDEHTRSSIRSQDKSSSFDRKPWTDSVNSPDDVPRPQLDMLLFHKDVQTPAIQFDNSIETANSSARGIAPDTLFHLDSNIPVLRNVGSQNIDSDGERSISSCPVEGVGDCIPSTDSAYISNMGQMQQIICKNYSSPIKPPRKLDQIQVQSYGNEDMQTTYSDQSADIRSIVQSCSTTESSDFDVVSISHDSELIDRSTRDSQGFHFFHRVFHRLVVSSQLGIHSRGESSGKNSKGQRASGSSSLSGTSEGSNALSLKHQRHEQGCGDEDGDKRDEPPLKRGKLQQPQCDARSRFLACPYWKLDPEKHWECFLKKNDTIGHLKQHLARRHTPKYYCQTCYAIFEDYGLYDTHVLERCCTRSPSAKLEGISQQQKISLSRRCKGSVENQWYAVWFLLFPEVEPPLTIYIYSTQSEDFCRLQEFAQREGLAVLLDELQSSGLLVRSGTSDQDLRSTLQRAINSMFTNYSHKRLQNTTSAWLPLSSGYGQASDVRSPVRSTANEFISGNGIAVGNVSSATAAEVEIPVDLTMASDNANLHQAITGTRPQPPAMAPRPRQEVIRDQTQRHQGEIYPATNLFSTSAFDESSEEHDDGLDFGSYESLEALDWDNLLLSLTDASG